MNTSFLKNPEVLLLHFENLYTNKFAEINENNNNKIIYK